MRRQSNDRFAIGLGVSLVVITLFLVLDVQTGWNLRGSYLPVPKSIVETDSIDDVPVNNGIIPQLDKIGVEDEDGNNGYVNNFDTFSKLKRTFEQQ